MQLLHVQGISPQSESWYRHQYCASRGASRASALSMAPTETARRAAQPDATNNDAIALSICCMFANFEITRPTAWHCNVWWLQTCRESRSEHHRSVVFACRLRAKDGNRRAISENLSPAIVTCASWSQERSGVAFTLHEGSATDERDESA